MSRILLAAVLAAAAYFAFGWGAGSPASLAAADNASVSAPAASDSEEVLANAFANRSTSLQVAGQGTVVKLLPDDNNGSRHQRFIVRLGSGQTLLMSHNIDLAPRINSLREGDTIAYYGEYEWNPKGGVIHWTHHDPQGRHPAGWIRHNGHTFQ